MTTLYRPIGIGELRLIHQSGMRAFPPRLPEQPIFYPVFELEYARKIAKEWNAKPGEIGFVTRFEVDQQYIDRFEVHMVGGNSHTELWVPAEELEEFNRHLVGPIEVIEIYAGEGVNLNPKGHDPFTDFVNDLLAAFAQETVAEPEEMFDAITSGEVLLPEFLVWLADRKRYEARLARKRLKDQLAVLKDRKLRVDQKVALSALATNALAAERTVRFHTHLDECETCRQHPFNLCPVGQQILSSP